MAVVNINDPKVEGKTPAGLKVQPVFPIGQHSQQDAEQILNNAYLTTQQQRQTLVAKTSLKHFYGFDYLQGVVGNSAGVIAKWVPFIKPIPNIVSFNYQPLGISTSTPTGILNTVFPYFTAQPALVMCVAGISQSGFSAQLTSSQEAAFDGGTFFHSSAYLFSWEVIAQVKY